MVIQEWVSDKVVGPFFYKCLNPIISIKKVLKDRTSLCNDWEKINSLIIAQYNEELNDWNMLSN